MLRRMSLGIVVDVTINNNVWKVPVEEYVIGRLRAGQESKYRVICQCVNLSSGRGRRRRRRKVFLKVEVNQLQGQPIPMMIGNRPGKKNSSRDCLIG